MRLLTAMLAAGATAMTGAAAEPLVVAELFTSQSCSSCPPAEAYFRQLSTRPGVLALEWHVDYWDRLRTADGAWKDPFSSPAHTARQRTYNVALRGTGGVYTPQAIINGTHETVGSNGRAIEILLGAGPPKGAVVEISKGPDLRIAVAGAPEGAQGLFVTYRLSAETRVGGGENAGQRLASAHIVTAAERFDPRRGATRPAPASGFGCAVLVSRKDGGPIIGAGVCPG